MPLLCSMKVLIVYLFVSPSPNNRRFLLFLYRGLNLFDTGQENNIQLCWWHRLHTFCLLISCHDTIQGLLIKSQHLMLLIPEHSVILPVWHSYLRCMLLSLMCHSKSNIQKIRVSFSIMEHEKWSLLARALRHYQRTSGYLGKSSMDLRLPASLQWYHQVLCCYVYHAGGGGVIWHVW